MHNQGLSTEPADNHRQERIEGKVDVDEVGGATERFRNCFEPAKPEPDPVGRGGRRDDDVVTAWALRPDHNTPNELTAGVQPFDQVSEVAVRPTHLVGEPPEPEEQRAHEPLASASTMLLAPAAPS